MSVDNPALLHRSSCEPVSAGKLSPLEDRTFESIHQEPDQGDRHGYFPTAALVVLNGLQSVEIALDRSRFAAPSLITYVRSLFMRSLYIIFPTILMSGIMTV